MTKQHKTSFQNTSNNKIMGLIREPKDVDFIIQSTPWTKDELAELSAIIKKAKEANKRKRKTRFISKKKLKV